MNKGKEREPGGYLEKFLDQGYIKWKGPEMGVSLVFKEQQVSRGSERDGQEVKSEMAGGGAAHVGTQNSW